MRARKLTGGVFVQTFELAPQRVCHAFEPVRLNRSVGAGLFHQVLQYAGKDLGPQRIQVGPHIGQPLGGTDQGVQLGQRLLNAWCDLLQQPRRFDGLRHVGVIHQRKRLQCGAARGTAFGRQRLQITSPGGIAGLQLVLRKRGLQLCRKPRGPDQFLVQQLSPGFCQHIAVGYFLAL